MTEENWRNIKENDSNIAHLFLELLNLLKMFRDSGCYDHKSCDGHKRNFSNFVKFGNEILQWLKVMQFSVCFDSLLLQSALRHVTQSKSRERVSTAVHLLFS